MTNEAQQSTRDQQVDGDSVLLTDDQVASLSGGDGINPVGQWLLELAAGTEKF
jgi:hypothetical protein